MENLIKCDHDLGFARESILGALAHSGPVEALVIEEINRCIAEAQHRLSRLLAAIKSE